MDTAVRFYTEALGLKLTNRFGNHWATVQVGNSLTIGLHPASADYPPPGTRGAVMIGLDIDEPIEQAVTRLRARGVRVTGEIIRQPHVGNFATIEDPDGNPMYLWEPVASLSLSETPTPAAATV
jgi:predicted enzyme related to lactoylglutathione lyase